MRATAVRQEGLFTDGMLRPHVRNVCISLAPGSATPGGPGASAVARGDVLAHFHANDVNDQAPGFGEVDLRLILQTLREVQYTGYVSLEPFRLEPDAVAVAKRSLQYLKECLGG